MRITLKNFRCHTDYTKEIPEQGLIALSGDNGSGKSTLFAAISYAFYGKNPGKKRKPFTHGKTTCSVEVEYMGMLITRKVPKRLIVTYPYPGGENYEGDEAQSIIIETLGMTYDEFVGSSYVMQRKGSDMSVLSLSPAQQIDFVQTLSTSTAKQYVVEVRDAIKNANGDLLGIQGEMKALQAQKEEKLELYPDVPQLPDEMERGIDPADVRQKIEVMDRKLEAISSSLEKVRPKLEKARADEKRRADQEAKINKFKIEIEQLQKLRDSLDQEPSAEDIEAWSQEIEEHKSSIDYYRRYLSYLKDTSALDKAIKEFNKSVDVKLEELEGQLLDAETIEAREQELELAEEAKKKYDGEKAIYDMETDKREVARKALADKFRSIKLLPEIEGVKDIKTASKMIAALKKEVAKRKLELRTKARRKLCCPGCSSYLVIADEGHLELTDDDHQEYDEDLKASIEASINIISDHCIAVEELSATMNTKITALGDAPEDPVALYKDLLKAKRLKQEYEELQIRKLPAVIERMQRSVDKASIEFGEETRTDSEEHIAILENDLHTKISQRDAANQLILTLQSHEEQITSKQATLSKLEKTILAKVDCAALEDQVTVLTKKMVDLSGEISVQRKILDNVADYEQYQHMLLEVDEISGRIGEAEGRHTALERKLEGLFGLEEAEKEAEILALEKTVSSINEHARFYLDQMFEDPIMVRLECTKDRGKKGVKLQLNTAIDYRGDTFDDIDELSGGERQKCDIAFLLAVNDMMGSNILILDECFNELHSSANTEVLSLIRDYSAVNKMVMVVSHEAVRGIFDVEIMVG